ncbi:6-hydroxymethylpterin diphosphokinase MptE-like protein [Methanonatronarchaeum sp. AMET6-2]|uniref:6-hydroxymethylpterin diphosphokinase MptE-like protein n=1 Tax=Methanonatronarchaeum sp. AMET6-2 TaxID=2933293 RepID=UPI001FF38E93|nr:6-hydroxymethylpterin diphosphokinase MptE-like protein [Methanonatronarchaeum sp. AMET6-2]UOY10482.1 DUF115 domain-containing protein [Methanonatronarchaeum sp. AMET6-2]
MDFDEWKPFYLEIVKDLNLNVEKDRDAAEKLDHLIKTDETKQKLQERVKKQVLVLGDAPKLKREIKAIDKDFLNQKTIITADNATKTALKFGITPDIITTDLDGDIKSILKADEKGSIIVVHGHGDNIELLERWVPQIENIVGSTQVKPIGKLINTGGFTDGDRAVYLADEYGANQVELCGFDFEDATHQKRRKLKWAKKLIRELKDRGLRVSYTGN